MVHFLKGTVIQVTVNPSSDINRSCSGFVTPVVGDVRTSMLPCQGLVLTDGLVFVLGTYIIKATFVKQHLKFLVHLVSPSSY